MLCETSPHHRLTKTFKTRNIYINLYNIILYIGTTHVITYCLTVLSRRVHRRPSINDFNVQHIPIKCLMDFTADYTYDLFDK